MPHNVEAQSAECSSYDIDVIFRAVENAVVAGPINTDLLGRLVNREPTQLLADLICEAGRKGYRLRCSIPYGTILALDEIR